VLGAEADRGRPESILLLESVVRRIGQGGHGNLTVTARYGPNKTRRMLRCRTCKTRFSERKGTPLFDTRLPTEKVVAVLAHVAEGIGTRKTARLTEVHTDTVARYTRRVGEHAANCTTSWSLFPPKTNEVQFDEKWAFVGQKQKTCDPDDDKCGDCWTTSPRPQSRLLRPVRSMHPLVTETL